MVIRSRVHDIVYTRDRIALSSRLVGLYNNLGVVYARLKQYPQALTAFSETLRIDPNYPGTQENINLIRKQQGE